MSLLDLWRKPSSRSSDSILPFIPKSLKWLVLIILLLNVKGLPLLWHVRVFRPAIYARIYHGIRNRLDSREQRIARLRKVARIGRDPFLVPTVFRTKATFDACDFNLHLSNSSYAMVFDMLRFKFVVENLPFVYPDGGWIALGATHYVFTREIPLNATYEVHLSIASWDKKWLYTVARFVTYPKTSSKILDAASDLTPNGSNAPTPARSSTPIAGAGIEPNLTQSSLTPVSHWVGAPLPEGALLHCTALSKACCKIGRITIPPEIILAANGYCLTADRYASVEKLRRENNGKGLTELYKGEWKATPKEERWWEDAFRNELLEQRRVNGLNKLAETIGLPSVY